MGKKSMYATQKQVEKYEHKVLNGFIESKIYKRDIVRLGSKRYIGSFADRLGKSAHKLSKLVLGNHSRRG